MYNSSVNEVFKLENIDEEVYLQLIHIDEVQMNSDVVIVYRESSPENALYLHTTVEQGIEEGLWSKADKNPREVRLSEFTFKLYMDDEFDEGIKPFWYYWACGDKQWGKIDAESGKHLAAEEGGIYPAADVIYRLANQGKSEFLSNWPKP